MARGIRAIAPQMLLVVKCASHMLVHPCERANTHIFAFGLPHCLRSRPLTSRDKTIDGRSGFVADIETESFAVDATHSVDAVKRLPAGLLTAGSAAHRLAPQPLLKVVDKQLTVGVGRSG